MPSQETLLKIKAYFDRRYADGNMEPREEEQVAAVLNKFLVPKTDKQGRAVRSANGERVLVYHPAVQEVWDAARERYQLIRSRQHAAVLSEGVSAAAQAAKADGRVSRSDRDRVRKLDAERDFVTAFDRAVRSGPGGDDDPVSEREQKRLNDLLRRLEASDDDLARRLAWSRKAVDYVLTKVGMRAGNWDDVEDAKDAKVKRLRGGYNKEILSSPHISQLDAVELIARKATKAKAGNCFEQSLVALHYLLTRSRVRPLENVCLADEDHCFVLIGRPADTDLNDWRTWGPSTVVCDPWASGSWSNDPTIGSYPASIFGPQMSRIAPFSKIESQVRVTA